MPELDLSQVSAIRIANKDVVLGDGSDSVSGIFSASEPPDDEHHHHITGSLMRLMGISGYNADEHIWFTGSEPVWILVPVTDPHRIDPPTGEANDLGALSELYLGQEIHVSGEFSEDSLPLAAMSFWISEDHEQHWQTMISEINETTFEETITVAVYDEYSEERIPYYWGLGLWVQPLENHRNVHVKRLVIATDDITYYWSSTPLPGPKITASENEPENPHVNDVWVNRPVRVWDGSEWVESWDWEQ